ncbi:hypothetical protein K469DRAFT_620267 [Zopfia rhizophila CBS 207.26]|uniref:Actin-like ATPase domain-containing protein n=1 Tax=Zopfia rhizophila CBS 207.26 TaxID=1314779 RepID=A0A6A6EN92_9PEZI|nr:hypothetical protein K469DRAFT_620267 [Zopfia rhizophila CBS 207.26]
MAAPRNRLVIGLDYGTTFTGIAFQSLTGIEGELDVDEFNIVDIWPPRVTSEKVPSEISYSPAPGRERQWGYDISQPADMDRGALKLRWTKLELDQQGRTEELRMILDALNGMKNLSLTEIERSHGIPDYPAMSPVDIVADYLSKVREYLLETLPRDHGVAREYLDTIDIDLVITVPAIWSDAAKNRTFRAVQKAQFDQRHFKRLRNIILVSEPEAAAFYALRSHKLHEEDESMVPGDCFVVCDAGGGTVDLISYTVKQVHPVLQLEEVALGTGDKCGASLIDRGFIKWLAVKLGEEDFKKISERSPEQEIGSHSIVEPKMKSILAQFELLKMHFTGRGSQNGTYIRLPAPLVGLHIPSRGIHHGDVYLNDTDYLEMFRPCIFRTKELILSQLHQVKQRVGYHAKCVFLTGGFGASVHLQNELRSSLDMRRISLKEVSRPWSAVVRGAVAKGLEPHSDSLISMRKCRRSYGIATSQPFSNFKHANEDEYDDPFDGTKKAKDQMLWLIKKGDALLSNTPKHAEVNLCQCFGLRDSKKFRTSLVSCDLNDPPARLDDVPKATRSIAKIEYDLTPIPVGRFKAFRAASNGQPYFRAFLKLEIQIKETVQVKVLFDKQELTGVSIEYQ